MKFAEAYDRARTVMPQTKLEAIGEIFSKQRELAMKFHRIEEENGFRIPTFPTPDIDDKFAQAYVRERTAFIVEEIGEAVMAINRYNSEKYDSIFKGAYMGCPEAQLILDEMSDILHFLVEMSIFLSFTPEQVLMAHESSRRFGNNTRSQGVYIALARTAVTLGMMCNTLKNKPWKMTCRMTDKCSMHTRLVMVWEDLFNAFSEAGCKVPEIHFTYFRKHDTNVTRINQGA